jgi:LAO/AO transport system kinase
VQDKIKHLLSQIKTGDTKSLARAITLVENEMPGYESLLTSLENTTHTNVIGITGPPGAGKSTLVNSLLAHWIGNDKKIAVLAVDPSSPFNYGALLGDRIRMSQFYNHPNVFIRSLASRGALGGLNKKILEITDVVKNVNFDFIVVETVGVGQSEVEIAGLADCTVVTLVPEAGDEVQTLKAGIMEIADVFVVNKADRENAEALYRNLRIFAHEKTTKKEDEMAVIKTVATNNEGVEQLANAIENYMSRQEKKEKKIVLLTDKAWQLIMENKMKAVSKQTLHAQINLAYQQPDFNVYSFIKQFI